MAENTVDKPRSGKEQPPITREPERYVTPAVDIYEDGDTLVIVADMPGIDKKNLSVRVEEGVLTIAGTAAEAEKRDALVKEFKVEDYFRQFRLSDEVDVPRIDAELKNGVLCLRLPKAERAKPREIPVKVF